MAQQNNKNHPRSDVLILIIGIIVILYSTIQTARGFEANTGGVIQAWIWAILIGLSLSYLAIELRKKLYYGNKAGALLMTVFYLFVALFSFIANFNTFYSGEIRNHTLNNHIDIISNKLSDLKGDIFLSLDKKPDRVNRMKITLERQILDPALPDWGPETQKIVDDLSSELDVKITKPAGKPSQKLEAVRRQIDELLKTHTTKVDAFKVTVNSKIDAVMQKFKAAKKSLGAENINEAISNAKQEYNSICTEALAVLKNEIKCDQLMGFNEEEIGQIQYTVKDALNHPLDALVPALQGALLDLVLPFMIFVSSFSRKAGRQPPQFPDRS